jgi:hypothetical protein
MRFVARLSQIHAFDCECIAHCLRTRQTGSRATSLPQSGKLSLSIMKTATKPATAAL